MYHLPHQFLPLLPGHATIERIAGKALEVVELADALADAVSPARAATIRERARIENARSSLAIERLGEEGMRPHMQAESELESRWCGENAFSSKAVLDIHAALFSRHPGMERMTIEGLALQPGKLRQHDVQVGRHAAPAWQSVPVFLESWENTYGRSRHGADLLIAAACAHQRLVWIHPFPDGNGRVARLQTHLALLPLTRGLWAVNRVFAENSHAYFQALSWADAPRQGDLDGRGNLSEKGLVAWADMFLEACRQEVEFQLACLGIA